MATSDGLRSEMVAAKVVGATPAGLLVVNLALIGLVKARQNREVAAGAVALGRPAGARPATATGRQD